MIIHVARKLLILLIIIITGTAKFSLTATFQKRIINNYNYWNCKLSRTSRAFGTTFPDVPDNFAQEFQGLQAPSQDLVGP